ncbi:MAG: helix-turn-helix transcriptional regulator [Clostridia bacterium]|nr:helix-turn-helix transcriptional regulator [Clostridia bacterium]
MSYFASNLKILRKEKNLTQPQLAKALNVSNGMISFWENGIYEPTASNIIAVAKFFDISIDELLLNPLI